MPLAIFWIYLEKHTDIDLYWAKNGKLLHM